VSWQVAVVQTTGNMVWFCWVGSGAAVDLLTATRREVPPIVRTVRRELKPFVLPALAAVYIPAFLHGPNFGNVSGLAICLACWAYARHDKDDDDRWKKRRQKLAAKVAEVGGRLQVVPAGSNS
jgi:hypothetical protein